MSGSNRISPHHLHQVVIARLICPRKKKRPCKINNLRPNGLPTLAHCIGLSAAKARRQPDGFGAIVGSRHPGGRRAGRV